MRSKAQRPKPGVSGADTVGSPRAQRLSTTLLAVTGMSPAVLTETVWALATENPPVIPDRVVVVTTIAGRQAIERELLTAPTAEGPALWQELRLAILGADGAKEERLILEPPRLVEAPNPRTGRTDWLEDLRTPAENNATANFVLNELRRWTETPDTRLVVSIAGGRKTMGALLYACVSLLGRESDRLTHVLVNDPFDDPRLKPKFYFPRQGRQELEGTDGRQWRAVEARIELADLPFVPFRNLFERDLVRKPSSFVELVGRCRVKVREIARHDVRLKLTGSRRLIAVNGRQVKLSPLQCVLLLFLAENARLARPAPEKYEAAIEPLRAFAEKMRRACVPEDGNDWREEAGLPGDFDGQRLRKLLDELKAKLRQAGPEAAALIPLLPEKGRFTLDLSASAITLGD
ncbi:MAG: CRISPR-associated ring nuclease Csm6 [Limisphaerales bacterium]